VANRKITVAKLNSIFGSKRKKIKIKIKILSGFCSCDFITFGEHRGFRFLAFGKFSVE
jgi:hypothetical protein